VKARSKWFADGDLAPLIVPSAHGVAERTEHVPRRDRGLRYRKHRALPKSNNRRYRTAIGDTVEPEAP